MPVSVAYSGRPRRVRFLDRPNRYRAVVALTANGRRLQAHVPNPGRMRELLRPGRTIGWIVPAAGARRATRWNLVTVEHRGTRVSIDSQIANRIVGRVLNGADVRPGRPAVWRAEVRVGHHRFDFGRSDGRAGPLRAILEVKSSNWRIGDTAMFPDAPTARGTAHLRALARAARRGLDARVLFAIQRSDVRDFAVHRLRDPEFADAFDAARLAGVRFSARILTVRPGGVGWGRAIPVRLLGPLGTYKDGTDPSPVR